jgi:hypothetical protein
VKKFRMMLMSSLALGGIAAMFVVTGINNKVQLAGIISAVTIALIGGYISGLILSL